MHRARAIHFFLFPLLNGNGELRLRFMGGVTLRRLRNFGFMAARLIVRHRQWTAKCTGAPSSLCHRITIPQRKRRKSPGNMELFQWALATGRYRRDRAYREIIRIQRNVSSITDSSRRLMQNVRSRKISQ